MEDLLTERPRSLVPGPEISVIVPARNEEAGLAACLESLGSQTGVSFELIVVDDGSTDRTAEIARSFPGVAVLDAGPLPEGWCGKSNAAFAGSQRACGEWLLFTDADTIHLPGALARSLAEVRSHGAALLSYSPAQELRGVIQRAVMPVIFAELAMAYRPREVCDPKSPAAAANGQYLLISREAYEAVGGHAAVASSLLEDVGLARAVKRSGRRIRFRFGGDAVRARMYRSARQLVEGWTKNLALLFPAPAQLAFRRLLEFTAILGGTVLAILTAHQGRARLALLCGAIAAFVYAGFLHRVRRAHAGADSYALGIVGLPIFSYLLLRSKIYYQWRQNVTWKGRQYSTRGPQPGSSGCPTGERWST